MKRKLKISYLLVISSLLCFALISLIPSVKASDGVWLSDYIEAHGEKEETDLLGGVKLYKQKFKSYYDGITTPGTPKYEFYGSTVQWVDLPATSDEVKMVVWSQGTDHNFKSSRTTLTAKHWEEKHPGWIVVAAINGDFFNINSTYEALGLMVQDGDVIRAHNHVPSSWVGEDDGVLAWDADNNLYQGFPTISNKLSLQVRNTNGEYEDKAVISSLNPLVVPDTGITLLTRDSKNNINVEGAVVYKGQYDFNRISNSGKAFIKGTVLEKVTGATSLRPENGEFYFASKDGSLDGLVDSDTYIRCQYNLLGEWANIESAIRYYCVLLKDGEHLFYQDSIKGVKNEYGLAKNPRTVIGFKEDGSVVMMVSDGRGMDRDFEVGLSYFQIAEMMRLAGCKDVYQMDGGGSATLVARNSQGNLEVINRPSDGSERSIGNAILMVMRDPGIKVDTKSNTRNSITIVKNETSVSEIVEEIKITIDGKTHSMSEELLTIEGLKESTDYIVKIEYVLPDYRSTGGKIKGGYTCTVRTKDFQLPPSGLEVSQINKNEIVITKRDSEYASWIQGVNVIVSGESYYMGDQNEIVISGLLDDTDYTVQFEYNVIEPGNDTIYKGKEEPVYIKTLAFNLPTFPTLEIVEKTEKTVKIAYEYDDEDDIALEVNVVAYDANGKEVSRQKVSRKRGNVTFEGLDLTNQEYTFNIEVLYYEKEGAVFASTYYSDSVKADKVEIPEADPVPVKKGCKKSSAELVIATTSALSLAVMILRKKK